MVTRWCSNPITNQPTATTDLLGYEHSSVRYRDRAITISLFISWDRLFTNRYTVMGSGRSCQVFIPKKCISWSLSHVQSRDLHSAIYFTLALHLIITCSVMWLALKDCFTLALHLIGTISLVPPDPGGWNKHLARAIRSLQERWMVIGQGSGLVVFVYLSKLVHLSKSYISQGRREECVW